MNRTFLTGVIAVEPGGDGMGQVDFDDGRHVVYFNPDRFLTLGAWDQAPTAGRKVAVGTTREQGRTPHALWIIALGAPAYSP